MRKIRYLIYGILIVALLVTTPALADPAKSTVDPCQAGLGARPLGMGKAFVGVADDCNAIFMNPAGLGFFKTWRVTSMSTTLLTQVNYLTLGGAYPTEYGVFGLGYLSTSAPGGHYISSRDPDDRIPETGEPINYGSHVLLLSYAQDLNKYIWGDSIGHLSVGGNIKFFNNSFSGGGQDGKSGTGIDLDLGALLKPNDWLNLGGVLQNILPFGSGGKLKWASGSEEEISPLTKWGGSVKVLGPKGLQNFGEQELLLSGDIDISINKKRPVALHMGAEWKPLKYLTLRIGLDKSLAAIGGGKVDVSSDLTAGVGLHLAGFSFDYAYRQDSMLGENSTHYFSISFSPEISSSPVAEEEKTETLVKSDSTATELEQKWTKLLNGKSVD